MGTALRSLVLLLAVLNSACRQAQPPMYVEARPLMGTLVEITLANMPNADASKAAEAAFRRMHTLSDTMNHYDPNSLVSQINKAAGLRAIPVTPELVEVLEQAAAVSQFTDGAFDITIGSITGWRFDPDQPAQPSAEEVAQKRQLVNYREVSLDSSKQQVMLRRAGMRIDLGGIAKLYILDQGMRELISQGAHAAMINGGGDIETIAAGQDKPWTLGIRDPWAPGQLYARLQMRNGFVASSGDYERFFIKKGQRYHHVLDPRTGMPTQGLRQVTLVAADLKSINGLSAAIMVLGKDAGIALLQRRPELAAVLMDGSGQVWTSPTLTQRLEGVSAATGR